MLFPRYTRLASAAVTESTPAAPNEERRPRTAGPLENCMRCVSTSVQNSHSNDCKVNQRAPLENFFDRLHRKNPMHSTSPLCTVSRGAGRREILRSSAVALPTLWWHTANPASKAPAVSCAEPRGSAAGEVCSVSPVRLCSPGETCSPHAPPLGSDRPLPEPGAAAARRPSPPT